MCLTIISRNSCPTSVKNSPDVAGTIKWWRQQAWEERPLSKWVDQLAGKSWIDLDILHVPDFLVPFDEIILMEKQSPSIKKPCVVHWPLAELWAE